MAVITYFKTSLLTQRKLQINNYISKGL